MLLTNRPLCMRADERLDYFLTRRGVGTWAAVRQLIHKQHVCVNEKICKNYHRLLYPADIITVDGRHICDDIDCGTLLFFKPAGLACSHDPHDRPHIYDAIPSEYLHPNLQSIGRLDRDTTGLLLLTIEGTWAQVIVAPEQKRWKRYQFHYTGHLRADAIERVRAGLVIDNDTKPCLPGYLLLKTDKNKNAGSLLICEGRHHQVKRMIAALGGYVTQLHRDRIGGLTLPADMKPGDCRPLSVEEREHLLDPVLNEPLTW